MAVVVWNKEGGSGMRRRDGKGGGCGAHVVRVPVAEAVMAQRPLDMTGHVMVVVVAVTQRQQQGVDGSRSVAVVPLEPVVNLTRPVLGLVNTPHYSQECCSQNRTTQ